MGLNGAIWRKSSYSGDNGAACVEVTGGVSGAIYMRDSKNPEGPVLAFSGDAWRVFLGRLKGHAPQS